MFFFKKFELVAHICKFEDFTLKMWFTFLFKIFNSFQNLDYISAV